MADKKVTELTEITNLSGDDLLLVVNDPLGTPTSRKITLTNMFADVAVATTHNDLVTFKANTTFNSSKVVMSANLIYQGTELGTSLDNKMDVANTTLLVNDRMQVANVNAYLANTNGYISNTTNRLIELESQFSVFGIKATSPIVNALNHANTPLIKVSTAKGIRGTVGAAPSSNNATTEGIAVGTIFFSDSHLYIATDESTIKRIALEVF